MNELVVGALKSEPSVTEFVAIEHGIDDDEYKKILSILGRTPTYTELGIFSVMWSEHCSYKNSIAELKKLPRSGPRLLVKAGEENAGLVDIGSGYAIAFKIESHNHPSAIEPYQGAATGVGGIMRDIFTMGARPIAALNSLRFGSLENDRTKYLLKGVVKGIGDYGNSFGVPTVAGDIFFDDCYNENPLVNAMAVGIVRHDRIARATAKGEGNLVMIVGSSTGRDGIHGATFASEEISEESEAKRPSVQVGDPFTEKLLLEATLEAIQSGLIVGIQDMGAAGISCSTSEMSAKGSSGMVIDLGLVPMREEEMTPYEIMLSESQERMLLVVEPKNEEKILSIFKKWDLQCRTIGRVTNDGVIRISMHQKLFAEIPSECLVLGGGAPVYHREAKEPEYISKVNEKTLTTLQEPGNYNDVLTRLLQSENICSRKWVTTQYDSMVRTNTIQSAIADAAVIRLKEVNKAIAVKTDCNPRYVYLSPYLGAQIAVAESARNVVCVGAKPLAITNCLNFGNPYKPEIFWQFKEAIRGISDACKILETPVTGGNVSFYNENPDGAIFPTPVIGMLGEINSVDHIMTPCFKNIGDVICLLGEIRGHLGGTEYVKCIHGVISGAAPNIDLAIEKRLQSLTLALIQSKLINSAHDISDGGLAVTLAESCLAGDKNERLGARIQIQTEVRLDKFLFGEDQSCIVVSMNPRDLNAVESLCDKHQISFLRLGYVIADKFMVNDVIDLTVRDMADSYFNSLETKLNDTV